MPSIQVLSTVHMGEHNVKIIKLSKEKHIFGCWINLPIGDKGYIKANLDNILVDIFMVTLKNKLHERQGGHYKI